MESGVECVGGRCYFIFGGFPNVMSYRIDLATLIFSRKR